MQITNLKLTHKFVHGVTVKKLLVAYDANVTTILFPWFDLLLFFLRMFLNRIRSLFEEALCTTQLTTEMAVLEFFLAISAAVAPGPFFDRFALVLWNPFGQHENRVVHIEHDMDFVIYFDL